MNILREEHGVQLNEGDLMAKGLFNLTDDKGNVSIWFDEETKDELLSLSPDDYFTSSCIIFTH